MIYNARKLFLHLLFCLFLLLFPTAIWAISVTQYREKIHQANQSLSSLLSTEESLTQAKNITNQQEMLKGIRAKLTAPEKVELDGAIFEVNNQPLLAKLSQIENEPIYSPDRAKLITELSENLSTLEKKLQELESQSLSNRTKDEEKQKPAIIVKNIEKTLPKQHSTPYNTILWEQNLYAKMDTLKQLYDIIDDYVFTLRQAEDVSIKEVFAYCISLQKTEYQEQICRRTFNTLLGSNILFTENNTPITKVYLPAIVAEIELFEDAENLIKAYLTSQLTQHLSENLDENKLNLLFYGKSVNVLEKVY